MDQELVQYLDERFNRVDQRFDRVEQRLNGHDSRFEGIDQRFEQIDRRFEGIDRQFEEVRREINERSEEVKRHSGVLVEGLRHEIQLVAEGFAMHIQVQHVQEREYHDRQHQETRALIRSFHDELRQQNAQFQQSQDHLRQRVENLERRDQN
jgi:archaellum component FlaC